MNNTNAWNKIPLEDYELHMEDENVAQSQMLNYLTKKYLKIHNPEIPLFLGISGGNGLEHIDVDKTKAVYGIDINNSYLETTQYRFGDKIKHLVLFNTDISTSTESFLKADFVWAALIFEYVNLEKGFNFIINNIQDKAKLIVTFQSNNGKQPVSVTIVETIKSVKDIFKVVNQNDLLATALEFGFVLDGSEENLLPNGKSFHTYQFTKN